MSGDKAPGSASELRLRALKLRQELKESRERAEASKRDIAKLKRHTPGAGVGPATAIAKKAHPKTVRSGRDLLRVSRERRAKKVENACENHRPHQVQADHKDPEVGEIPTSMPTPGTLVPDMSMPQIMLPGVSMPLAAIRMGTGDGLGLGKLDTGMPSTDMGEQLVALQAQAQADPNGDAAELLQLMAKAGEQAANAQAQQGTDFEMDDSMLQQMAQLMAKVQTKTQTVSQETSATAMAHGLDLPAASNLLDQHQNLPQQRAREAIYTNAPQSATVPSTLTMPSVFSESNAPSEIGLQTSTTMQQRIVEAAAAAAAIDISDGTNEYENEKLSFSSAGAKFGTMIMAHNKNMQLGGADPGTSVRWLASHSGCNSSAATMNAMVAGAALVAQDQERNKDSVANGHKHDEHRGSLQNNKQTAGLCSATVASLEPKSAHLAESTTVEDVPTSTRTALTPEIHSIVAAKYPEFAFPKLWRKWLASLRQRGYFDGTVEGSRPYRDRMSKARIKFAQISATKSLGRFEGD